jgi:hypothetical protein
MLWGASMEDAKVMDFDWVWPVHYMWQEVLTLPSFRAIGSCPWVGTLAS